MKHTMVSGIGVISTVTILTTSNFRLECVAKALGRRDGTQEAWCASPWHITRKQVLYEEAISFIDDIYKKKPCVSSRFKQTSASSANGNIMKEKPRRWAGYRHQIHGFRIACGSDKAEVVRKELQVLWRSREWSAEEWQLAAAQHTAEKMEKMGLGWRPISP